MRFNCSYIISCRIFGTCIVEFRILFDVDSRISASNRDIKLHIHLSKENSTQRVNRKHDFLLIEWPFIHLFFFLNKFLFLLCSETTAILTVRSLLLNYQKERVTVPFLHPCCLYASVFVPEFAYLILSEKKKQKKKSQNTNTANFCMRMDFWLQNNEKIRKFI